jgi:hypothetical protein
LKHILLILIIISSLQVSAQSVKAESVEMLLDLTSSKELIDNINKRQSDVIYKTLIKNIIVLERYQPLHDQFKEDYYSLMASEMSWEKIKPSLVEVYSEIFTQSEIEKIIKFYSSSVGKKMLKAMPMVMTNVEYRIQKLLNDFQPKVVELQTQYINELNSQMEQDSNGY